MFIIFGEIIAIRGCYRRRRRSRKSIKELKIKYVMAKVEKKKISRKGGR